MKSIQNKQSSLMAVLFRFADLFFLLAASYIAAEIKFYTSHLDFINYRILLLVTAILILLLFPLCKVYLPMRGRSFYHVVKSLILGNALIIFIITFIAFFTKTSLSFSREWVCEWISISFLLMAAYRFCLYLILRYFRNWGFNRKKLFLVGSSEIIGRFLSHMKKMNFSEYDIFVATFESKSINVCDYNIFEMKMPDNIDSFIRLSNIDEVCIALPLVDEPKLKKLLCELRHSTANISYVPDLFGFDLLNHSISDFCGTPVINLRASPMVGLNRIFKAVEDRLIALGILLLISPLLLAIAVAVKLSSKGPVSYRQKRMTWNGSEFNILKFRTMPVESETSTGAVWAKSGENRATKVGAFLRRTSLDELPQFLNVLKGDMSIVGPRPERPVFVDKFKDEIPFYMQKHMVKAGITGWAQVNGWRGNTDLNKRIEHDIYYIENWSFWFDIKIILLTIVKGFINKNAY